MSKHSNSDIDIMIDLETLGTGVDAPIISIGCQVFDAKNLTLGSTFYVACDIRDQIDSKLRFVDASTLKWWLSQGEGAKAVFKEGAVPTPLCLQELSKWILREAGSSAKTTKKAFVWGNGSSFDITLMETLFKAFNEVCPWMFYKVMDLRTFKRFVADGKKVEVKQGVAHNALDDARAQAQYVIDALRIEREEKEELKALREVMRELQEAENE